MRFVSKGGWADVDRIEKYFFLNDLLYVTAFEVIGPSLSLAMPFKLLQHSQASTALTGFTGWPEGQLAEDLKWGASQLFQNWPVTQRSPSTSQPHSSGLSQEERLLAALSHASIVFQMIGIVVPIVVWATQKKKSAYASFQALQAAVWQGIALAFGMIVPVCMTGVILVPIFMIIGSQQDSSTLAGASFGWTIFATMAVSLVLVLANAIFWIYGIVGAVMAYQGEDFRYAIIGNRLEKRGLGPAQQTGAGP